MKLGVNIDHIATLRQARREEFPSPLSAAQLCLKAGAHGIVAHLREDRRHIQDQDMYALRKIVPFLDMEMALTNEMVKIALDLKPNMCCMVPEKRQEITTEGGLNVNSQLTTNNSQIKSKIKKLQDAGIIVSLFIDPEEEQIRAAAESGAKYIELHTGAYANAGEKGTNKPCLPAGRSQLTTPNSQQKKELNKIKQAVNLARSLNLKVNAGHGLDYYNVRPIAEIDGIKELNIGFSIVARAVFVGIPQAVREMLNLIKQSNNHLINNC